MKSTVIKFCSVALLITVFAASADAQRGPRRRPANSNAGNTGGQDQQQNNVSKLPSGYNPTSNIPIRVDTGTGSSNTSNLPSRRNDGAFDRSGISEVTPLPYEHLRPDDALFAEKVWREIDLREKMNMPFRYKAADNNGDQQFVSILLKAVQSGEVTAFSGNDDRFTTPLSSTEVASLTSGGSADTTAVRDINDPNKITEYVVTRTSFDPESVLKLRIKEEWVFDREASRLFVRILGIAPLKTEYVPGTTKERGSSVMFWVYYPDMRPILARYQAYNSKNMGTSRMTWEELLEARMFSSYVTKSTLDNPLNKTIRQVQKDPILALLEGDNIKDKIFNYEQDLWSY
jgi:gliding motility associated protien GldN